MNKGFTPIEIVVTVTLLLIVLAITLVSFSNLDSTNALETSVAQTVSVLTEARSKTLASENDAQYGVHLASDEIVLFVGSTFTPGHASNTTFSIHNKVEIVDISLAGSGSNIVFDRLSGETSQNGTFIMRLKEDTNASTTISIYGTGIIETN